VVVEDWVERNMESVIQAMKARGIR
jgi:hypothetical protein